MAASLFVQGLINGLNQGAIYALIALGYTMVYGIIRMIKPEFHVSCASGGL